jgi:membrane protein implicated in regulation of membrane protease activity
VAVFWIAIAIVFAVAEVLTVAFFALFVTIAALGAAVAAAAGLDIVGQSIVFFVLAVVGLVVGRPPLMRYLRRRRPPALPTGAQVMVGRTALVTDPIPDAHQPGHVQIMGERWPAISADGSPIKAGQQVLVLEIRNATLVVAK